MTKFSGYSIEHFSSARQGGFGGSGFSITVSEEIVNALINTKKEKGERVTALMLDIFERTFGTDALVFARNMTFYRDSWMLTSLCVGSDCACFSTGNPSLLDGGVTRDIKFSPHNIDTPEQAACLLAMWLLWFNHAAVYANVDLPMV